MAYAFLLLLGFPGLPPELAERVTTAVKHRELQSKGIPVDAYERSKEVQEDLPPEEEEAAGPTDMSFHSA